MTSGASALSVDGLGMRRGHGRWIFRDVTVHLRQREIVALNATAGGGASTLLQALAGVLAPTRGTVRFRPPVVGFVPQHFPSNLAMSPEDYLNWIGRVRGMRPDVRQHRIAELVRTFELGPAARQRLTALPEGEARTVLGRRLAIMQALLDEPALLILDDPWTVADAHLRDILAKRVLDLAARGCLVIYSGSAPALRPSRYLVLAGGTLAVSEADPAQSDNSRMRFELTGHGSALDGLSGVIEQHRHPDGLVLTVERAHSDELIGRVIAAGWSVRRVEPGR
ncbi:MAG: ATP-binding cassette domain-containing protein [Jatrophihabitans sp.]